MFGEKETYEYMGILEADTIKRVATKEIKIKEEYLGWTRKLLETKLYRRKLIKRDKYPRKNSGPFLKWTSEELQQMDLRTRKLVTMHQAFHPRDDVDKLYEPRKEGGRGLASIQDSVDASIQQLEDYIKSAEEDWLQPLETIQSTEQK